MKKTIDRHDFQVSPEKKVHLDEWPTLTKPFYDSKKEYEELLQKQVEVLSSLQRLHYASNRILRLRLIE